MVEKLQNKSQLHKNIALTDKSNIWQFHDIEIVNGACVFKSHRRQTHLNFGYVRISAIEYHAHITRFTEN